MTLAQSQLSLKMGSLAMSLRISVWCFGDFYLCPEHPLELLKVLGARINRAGHGLEVPVRFYFQGPSKAITWAKKSIDAADKVVEDKLNKCTKMPFKGICFM